MLRASVAVVVAVQGAVAADVSVMVTEPIKNVFNAQNIPVVITDIGVRSGDYISLIITDN